MKECSLGFSTARTWNPFSALIRWHWGTEYSHVYIRWATPWDFDEILEASGTSVQMKNEETWKKKNKSIDTFNYELTREQFNVVMKKIRINAGRAYGWKQVVGIIIAEAFGLKKNPFADKQRTLICSELALIFLEEVLKIDVSGVDPDLVSPKDIHELLRKHKA